jgi:YlmC/YmxH family sporulation protein
VNKQKQRCTITDLRCKEVINICDGKRLGYVSDVYIDLCTGRLTAIVVPRKGKLLCLFGKEEEGVIPWEAIRNIGDDIILVEEPERVPAGGAG